MYRLYVDEVGTDGLTNTEADKHRYLSLTGIAMKIGHARDNLTPNMNWIKANIFNHDPDAPLVFHRKDILGFKGPYEILRDDEVRARFDKAVLRLFAAAEFRVITTLIDKEWMKQQHHWNQKHPYHYLMEMLVEKYAQFLERMHSIGDIMPESRKEKDRPLQVAFEEVREHGTQFLSSARIQSAIRARNLKFRTKAENIAGLQLCDLIAHPSHMCVREVMNHEVHLGKFCIKVKELLFANKYDRSNTGLIEVMGLSICHNENGAFAPSDGLMYHPLPTALASDCLQYES